MELVEPKEAPVQKPAKDMFDPKSFLAKVGARASRGLSQEALAHECGINRTYLSGVERSERNVSIDNIARIAGGLRVEPAALLQDQ
jgi:DNA-binding XRE family transcriptional regulator